MNLQEEHINFIKNAFSKMKSKDDFLDLLNYSKKLIYGEKVVPFYIRHIDYHCDNKNTSTRYHQFSIKKKSGADRVIHSPNKGLKAIQKCLNLILQTIYDVNPSATGFVPGKSIVDNSKVHAGSFYVYNIDLKDFFPSIEAGRISKRFQNPPFNLNKKTDRIALATIIARLSCQEMKVERIIDGHLKEVIRHVLPQGAPTSPTLTNIICQSLDYYLNAVAKQFGLKYSRYADDITFSSIHNVYSKNCKIVYYKNENNFLQELDRIITSQGFIIKESKTRLQKQGYRQEVTGLIVNDKINVQKRYIKQLRMWLYYWEHYGYEKANVYFLPQYNLNKAYTKKGQPNMVNVIAGKLDYLKMVKGDEDGTYLKLRERFELVTASSCNLDVLLDIWEKEGIDKAIDVFNHKY